MCAVVPGRPGGQRRLLLLCSHSTTPAAMTGLLSPAAPGLGGSLHGGLLTPHPVPAPGKAAGLRSSHDAGVGRTRPRGGVAGVGMIFLWVVEWGAEASSSDVP